MAKKHKKSNRGDGLPKMGRPLQRVIQDKNIAHSKMNSRLTSSRGEMFGANHPEWYDQVLMPAINAVSENMWPIFLSPNMVVMGVKMTSDNFKEILIPKIREINTRFGKRCLVCGHLDEKLDTFILGYEWTYAIVACVPGAKQLPKWLTQGHIRYFLGYQNIQELEYEEAESILENLRNLLVDLDQD